jgi:hypothetical protein
MLDVIGAIAGTAIYAVVIGVIVGFSPVREPMTRAAIFAAAAVWGGIVVAIAAAGGFASAATGGVPAPVLAFFGALGVLLGGWFLSPRFRSALLSVPFPVLIGVNAARLGGVFFLLLEAEGRLSAPFAPLAGVGDMVVGALAIPLAVMAAGIKRPAWIAFWNALGVIDLVVALSLGFLSAPGTPFRVFTEGPGTLAMTTLPWIMVPTMLVPLYLLIHLTIAVKLKGAERTAGAPSPA